LLLGWVVGLPVPVILAFAPDWSWILFANVLLGANQALAWSMTVNMKIDLAGPRQRGLATGLNEFAGYTGVATVAFLSGLLAEQYGFRATPLSLGMGLAMAGLFLSLLVRDTGPELPTRTPLKKIPGPQPLTRDFVQGTWGHPALSAASVAGLAVNLKDGMLWGLLPILLLARGLNIGQIGLVVAIYPAVWGVMQLASGPISDRIDRRVLIGVGLAVQAAGLLTFVLLNDYTGYLAAAALVGLGTALVYPTLQAYVSDQTAPAHRAGALGVYRFWRDLGYAVGALGAGLVADAIGIPYSLLIACMTLLIVSVLFIIRTREERHGLATFLYDSVGEAQFRSSK
jgi:MFS family permease